MKISIDIDGTLTRFPEVFRKLGKAVRASGGEVYVLTGNGSDAIPRKMEKYPVLADDSWYDRIITTAEYDEQERSLVPLVLSGVIDNHILVGIFKRRVCHDLDIDIHFDDDTEHVRAAGAVPVFGVAKQ